MVFYRVHQDDKITISLLLLAPDGSITFYVDNNFLPSISTYDSLNEWRYCNILFQGQFKITDTKIVYTFVSEDGKNLPPVEGEIRDRECLITTYIDKKSKEQKLHTRKYLCTFDELTSLKTMDDFCRLLSERIPEFKLPEAPKIDPWAIFVSSIEYAIDYDPAKDPLVNPWIEILGDDEEAEAAYWNTE